MDSSGKCTVYTVHHTEVFYLWLKGFHKYAVTAHFWKKYFSLWGTWFTVALLCAGPIIINYLFLLAPPKFTDKSPNPQKVNKSSHLKLICEASGKPSPNITWTKDGSDSVLHTGSTWNLTNISSDDAGTYRCTADNGAGSAVSHTVQVIVECMENHFIQHLQMNNYTFCTVVLFVLDQTTN